MLGLLEYQSVWVYWPSPSIMKSSFFQLCAEYSKEVSRCLWTCTFWPGDIYGSSETKNEFIYFYFLAENWQSYIRNAYILGIFESHFWKPHKWFESNSYIENLYGFSKDFPGPIFLELSNGACPLDDSNPSYVLDPKCSWV